MLVFRLPTDEKVPIHVFTAGGRRVPNRIQVNDILLEVYGSGPGIVIGKQVKASLTEDA